MRHTFPLKMIIFIACHTATLFTINNHVWSSCETVKASHENSNQNLYNSSETCHTYCIILHVKIVKIPLTGYTDLLLYDLETKWVLCSTLIFSAIAQLDRVNHQHRAAALYLQNIHVIFSTIQRRTVRRTRSRAFLPSETGRRHALRIGTGQREVISYN